MGEVDIYYMTDPRRPILQCSNCIYGIPDEYRLYSTMIIKKMKAATQMTKEKQIKKLLLGN